ncbi:MAG: heat-inducible transcription repressor HrcA [Myxococcales bacterium]|nr:heat-inducible transcription repressor HrcA [Myxococcales bacterium]MCB9731554.1 heat-inducible transcription repressor HrcA [Deltaproteobacteria bacterium]
MSSSAAASRERLILREVVESYILSGEAVGSKAIAARLKNRLSSASIRNVMSDLCEQGLLEKPHTSAGRVPTDRGYRNYLDQLVRPLRALPLVEPASTVDAVAWNEGTSSEDVLRAAVRLLGTELGAATVALTPRLETAILSKLEFVWLRAGRLLAIAITRGGIVHERLLHVDADIRREDLEALSNYLNSLLPGRTLDDVRAVIEAEQERDRNAHGELERRALDLGRRAFGGAGAGSDDGAVVIDGAARILETKEFAAAPEKAAELLRAIEQRALWLDVLRTALEADDTEVYVGHELGTPALEPCGVVASRYQLGGGAGLIVVVGPKRLDYRRAIPLVGRVAEQLSRVLRAAEGDEELGA